ncbi:ATP-binding protein [Roseateles saccharophilus]|uniref:histidine kinase n=1 Tax=Roseateles saccharophilus TaxID=304 RepID=A0A4R3UVL1_ROSSA|nr:ATP-binding protein [Roseateles saccharophilus]MDG0835286.1 HAMP domain-containing protein [Roseateles saccharophilus]TCU96195.1 two-component system OmpR family sensor kinase/two-component system sensor histidine kinase QseC [Roseateles saccharophilus]
MTLLGTLRGRLFALLAALGAVTALAVGGATYVSVRAEADELFDYQLRQTALSLRDQGRVARDEAAALADPNFDYVVQIWSLQGLELYSSRPQGMTEPLPARAVLGYSNLHLAGQDWRVFGAATPLRVVQVAQPIAVRQRLAAVAALRSIVPVAIALPFVAALVWWLIGVSLAPLARVASAAGTRGANALDALPTAGLPGEVGPLVDAFNSLLARLATAFDAQRSFVADAAHELRTPLTALKLQLGLLRDSAPGPEQDAAIARLRGGIDRAVRLVEQLLALARAEPGAAAPVEGLDLADIARQAVADLQPLADKAGIALTLDAPAPLPLEGDPQALRSALRNLIDNAVKYGARHVQVAALRAAGAPLLRVDDDGPGIPLEARERVFDRFQRGESAGTEGSGLGLAIVQAAARQQGASVRLDTSPLGGLRAEIRWARHRPELAAAQSPPTPP